MLFSDHTLSKRSEQVAGLFQSGGIMIDHHAGAADRCGGNLSRARPEGPDGIIGLCTVNEP
jgi:hypothetical protein